MISVCKLTVKQAFAFNSRFQQLISPFYAESGNSNSRVNSECDLDSVCSDSSWVITPAPTFQRSSDPAHPGVRPAHSLEDLLIEHPTMSVYRQNSTNELDSTTSRDNQTDTPEQQVIDETNEERNQIRQRAFLENQRRLQLAAQMQIPVTTNKTKQPPPKDSKPQKLTRRALKRHNPMSRHGAKHQVQKCGFKAGRRRC